MSSSSRQMKTPSRRMTLGGVPMSSNTTNQHTSLDVGGLTTPGKGPPRSTTKPKPPRGGRKSMIPRVGRENLMPPSPAPTSSRGGSSASKPTANSRRRSVGGRESLSAGRRQSLVPPSSAPTAKPDPRPINDKKYQQECIRRLLQFLSSTSYEYPVTTKSLARPSGKDFGNIVTHMLRLLDSSFQDGTMKLEDEIAMNFKAMGYPYPISKTALVAAGSPHTWPALLAALTWLMEHMQCFKTDDIKDSAADNGKPFESLHELEQKTDKAFFQYLGQAYTAFLKGDVATQEQVETNLAERFERDDTFLEQELERITDLNATIAEKINHLKQESQDLPTYAKKREDYANDLEEFHGLIGKMEEHKNELSQKIKERTVDLAETNAKLTKMNAYVQELKSTVSGQALSTDDIFRMESEEKGVNESIHRILDTREQRRKALLAGETELDRLCNKLDSVLADYNTKIGELALSPELASFAKSKATFDKSHTLDADQTKMLGVDLQASVRPMMLQSKAEYVEKGDQARCDYQDALDKLETSQESYKEAGAKLDIVQHKNSKCQETLEFERDAQDAKLAVRQREVEAMETKVATLRDPVALEEQMAGYERQCAELEALQIKHKDDNIAQKKAVQNEIESAFRLMTEHDDYCRRKMSDLDQYWLQKKAKMGKVKVPANVVL